MNKNLVYCVKIYEDYQSSFCGIDDTLLELYVDKNAAIQVLEDAYEKYRREILDGSPEGLICDEYDEIRFHVNNDKDYITGEIVELELKGTDTKVQKFLENKGLNKEEIQLLKDYCEGHDLKMEIVDRDISLIDLHDESDSWADGFDKVVDCLWDKCTDLLEEEKLSDNPDNERIKSLVSDGYKFSRIRGRYCA